MTVYKKNEAWYYNFMILGKVYRGTCLSCYCKEDAKEFELAEKKRLKGIKPIDAETELVRSFAKQSGRTIIESAAALKTAFEIVKKEPVKKRTFDLAWGLRPYVLTVKRDSKPLANAKRVKQIWDRFGQFCKSRSIKYIEDVSEQVAMDFINSLTCSASSKNVYKTELKVCFDLHNVAHNPFSNMKKFKEQKERREIFTKDEIKVLFEYVANNRELSLLLKFLLYTGKRLGEVKVLSWENIKDDYITIYEFKNGREAIFPLANELKEDLMLIPKQDRVGALFKHYVGMRIDSLSKVIKNTIKHAGIGDGNGRHYGAHSFRHTFASACAKGGIPLSAIQNWLGHSSQIVTKIYAEHFSLQERCDMLKKIKF